MLRGVVADGSRYPALRVWAAAQRACPPAALRCLDAVAVGPYPQAADHSWVLAAATGSASWHNHGRLRLSGAATRGGFARAVADIDNAPPEGMAAEPLWPAALLRAAVRRHDPATFAHSDAMPPDALAVVAALPDSDCRAAAAASAACGPNLLRRMARDPDIAVRAAAVSNPACDPAAVRAALGPDSPMPLVAAAASNPNCSSEDLDSLAHGGAADAAAGNPACPQHLFETFAESSNTNVRRAVAQRLDCPADLLVRLAGSPALSVRAAVASNSACPRDLFETLADDPYIRVRAAAAANPAADTETLLRLSHPQEPRSVSDSAQATLCRRG